MNFDDYLPIRVVAEKLGVHVQTVRRWIYSGTIPPELTVKVGGKWFVHRDVLNIKLEEEKAKSLFSLPPVNPNKLFWVYGNLRKGLSIRDIAGDLQISEKRAYDYVRFLIRVGLVERKNGSYVAKGDIYEFTEFLLRISDRLREMFSELLSIINNTPLNYDALTRNLARMGYNVTPTKVRNIISILKKFGVIVATKKVVVVNGSTLEEKILNLIRARGGIVKFGEITKYYGREPAINQAIINLLKERAIRVRTIPRNLILIAKAIVRSHGRDDSEIYLPVRSAIELKKLTQTLAEMINVSQEKAENIVRKAAEIRPDLISISRDRPRPEYGGKEPPEIVFMSGPIKNDDIIELLEG